MKITIEQAIEILKKERDALERCVATDGEYSDKEILEVQTNIIKKQHATFSKLIMEFEHYSLPKCFECGKLGAKYTDNGRPYCGCKGLQQNKV